MCFPQELLRRLLPPIFVVDDSVASPMLLRPGDIISLFTFLVSLLGFGVAAVGIWLTYLQIKKNREINRVNFLKEFYTTMFSDEEIRAAWYLIEYDRFVYTPDAEGYDTRFHESELEKPTDRLLTFIDLICSLYARDIITEAEMDYFKYEIKRMYSDRDLENYLTHVREEYKKVLGKDFDPYKSYVAYCEKHFPAEGKDRFRQKKSAPAGPPAGQEAAYFVLPIRKARNMHVWLR